MSPENDLEQFIPEDDGIEDGPTFDSNQPIHRYPETSPFDPELLERIDPTDTFSLYKKEAGSVPLLNHQQEIELAKRIERGEKARIRLAEGVENENKRSQLSYLIQDGMAAEEHMIRANQRLVISVAKKYRGRGVSLEDLIGEGNIGLIRALKKFEYQRGNKFSTYATWWIRQAVSRAVKEQGRTIRIPIQLGDTISRIKRTELLLTQELGKTPTLDELSQAVQIPTKELKEIKKVSQNLISLDSPPDDEEERELHQRIEDSTAIRPEDNAERILMYQKLRDRISSLDPKEQKVIMWRFGFIDGISYTLKEVGGKMGLTRERVRQIEEKAIRKLRKLEKM